MRKKSVNGSPFFSYPLHKRRDHARNVVQLRRSNAWIHSDPEKLVHDFIGIFQSSGHPVVGVRVRGLLDEITAEQHAGGNAVVFQVLNQICAGKGSAVLDE